MQKNIPRRAYLKLFRNPFVKALVKYSPNHYNPEDAIIIAGCPRSGTTWISDVFSSSRGVTKINEPLNYMNEALKKLGISWRTYIPPEEENHELANYFLNLFSGRTADGYYTRDTHIIRILNTRTWLIKFIRANRILPWILNNFSFKHKPILIVRHPCGVVNSQIKHPRFEQQLNVPKDDLDLIKNHYPQYLDVLDKVNSEEEIRALSWALDNIIPLHYFSSEQITVISYEQLVLESNKVLERIYSEWGEDIPPEVIMQINKRSREAKDWSQFDEQGKKKLGVWRDHLSHSKIDKILNIVHEIGLTEFTSSITPNYTKLFRQHTIST